MIITNFVLLSHARVERIARVINVVLSLVNAKLLNAGRNTPKINNTYSHVYDCSLSIEISEPFLILGSMKNAEDHNNAWETGKIFYMS